MPLESLDREQRFAGDVTPYQLFMLTLCAWALLVLAADTLVAFDSSTQLILQYADNVVCALFFADFVYSFLAARRKSRYLVTWGWIDLLSSIPALDALRWRRPPAYCVFSACSAG